MSKDSRTILVVEDDPIIQALVQQGLGGAGYVVETAGSGKALFDILNKDSEKIDLILLDLGLPDGDALPHIVDIRKITSVPIVVLTGRERIDDRLMALGLGADDYMTKPVDIRELVLRVSNIISRRGDGPAPAGAPIVVDGNRIKNPPKAAPAQEKKQRSPVLVGALVLIGIAIGGAGAFWLTLDDPSSISTTATNQTESVQPSPTQPEPASEPETATTSEDRAPISSVAETVVVTEQTEDGGSRSVITSAPDPETAASSVLDTDTRAEALGYQWVLNTTCGRVPQID